MPAINKMFLFSFIALAALTVGLSIAGGLRWYTPVPYWDMWIGYLGFYVQLAQEGNISWWSQHNEHRIVLGRMLFWLDLAVFQGRVYLLIIVNYLLISMTSLLFCRMLKERLPAEKDHFTQKIFYCIIISLLFSWMQRDNLIWGFQGQFILAQLLPLLAFYLLHRAFKSELKSKPLFFLACLTGVSAVLSMANGVLTLPFMTLFAVLLRMRWQRICLLLLLSAVSTILYFYNYHAPAHHGSLKSELFNNPTGLFQYLLLFIGGPVYYLTGKVSDLLSQLAGVFLIVSSVYFAVRAIKKPSSSSLPLALLFFLLYFGGSALAAGGSRLSFGLDQALTSRYQTPALMGWLALLILYAPFITKAINNKPKQVLAILLLIPLSVLPTQIEALPTQQDTLFEGWLAVLALELGIRDQQQISFVSSPSAELHKVTEIAVAKNLSVFNHPIIKNVRQLMGKTVNPHTPYQCQGSIDSIASIKGVNQYKRISGWIYQADNKTPPEIIHILSNHHVIGYALSGSARADVKIAVAPEAHHAGYKGYLLSRYSGQELVLRGYNPDCELRLKVPAQ